MTFDHLAPIWSKFEQHNVMSTSHCNKFLKIYSNYQFWVVHCTYSRTNQPPKRQKQKPKQNNNQKQISHPVELIHLDTQTRWLLLLYIFQCGFYFLGNEIGSFVSTKIKSYGHPKDKCKKSLPNICITIHIGVPLPLSFLVRSWLSTIYNLNEDYVIISVAETIGKEI